MLERPLRIGTFCTGIHAPGVAYERLGWRDVFFSEIEPFCCEVLRLRYPGAPNLGDMTAVEGRKWRGKVDGLIAGTPCQSFSLAGERGSLADDRGNLTLVFVELVHGIDPVFVVWENVPGVLSTKDNAFGCFLAGMVGEQEPLASGLERGRWPNAGVVVGPVRTLAWRVLDAQYFGLAQRRRRVFVVSFRTRDGLNPGAVLLEPESLPGDPPTSEEEGPVPAALTSSGVGTCGADDNQAQAGHILASRGCYWDGGQLSDCLDTSQLVKRQSMPDKRRFPAVVTPIDMRQASRGEKMTNNRPGGSSGGPAGSGIGNEGDPAPTVAASHTPAVFSIFSHDSCAKQRHAKETDLSATIDAHGGYSPGQGGTVVAFSCKDHGADAGDVSPPLRAMGHKSSHENGGGQVAVAFDTTQITSPENRCKPKPGDPSHPLAAGAHPPALAFMDAEPSVRRLTPRECERLQGFPDDYTLIPWRGKSAEKCPDSPRYRCLGNSMAVKCLVWICERVDRVLCREVMAS